MSIRTQTLPSVRACAFGLPTGIALFTTSAILLLIGIAALATAVSVVMLPHESKALGPDLAILQGFHPRQTLLPFIVHAHDRIGFGGAPAASGLAILPIVWFVEDQNRLATLRLLLLVRAVSAMTAIGVHPLVGYNSLPHLLPFLVKDGAFLLALFAYRKGW